MNTDDYQKAVCVLVKSIRETLRDFDGCICPVTRRERKKIKIHGYPCRSLNSAIRSYDDFLIKIGEPCYNCGVQHCGEYFGEFSE